MEATWIFKPKYNQETCRKLIDRFADHYLDWHNQGIDLTLSEVRAGWFELRCVLSEPSVNEYWTDTCGHDAALTGKDLTDGMMILLVEAGIAWNLNEDYPEDPAEYSLEDVDMGRVITVLCEEGTNVYSPQGSKCWVQPIDGTPKDVDLLEALLSLQVA